MYIQTHRLTNLHYVHANTQTDQSTSCTYRQTDQSTSCTYRQTDQFASCTVCKHTDRPIYIMHIQIHRQTNLHHVHANPQTDQSTSCTCKPTDRPIYIMYMQTRRQTNLRHVHVNPQTDQSTSCTCKPTDRPIYIMDMQTHRQTNLHHGHANPQTDQSTSWTCKRIFQGKTSSIHGLPSGVIITKGSASQKIPSRQTFTEILKCSHLDLEHSK